MLVTQHLLLLSIYGNKSDCLRHQLSLIAPTFYLTSSVGLRFDLSVTDEFSSKRSKDAIAPLQLAVAIILEELEDEIQ